MSDVGYKVHDLGELHGQVLIFGGPYSNLQASQELLRWTNTYNIPAQNRICTGDIVAYCANPVETLRLWQGACVLVAGNCEKQLGLNAEDCGCGFIEGSHCDLLSREWFPFARAHLTENDRKYLGNAPDVVVFSHNDLRYAVIHGGLNQIAQYIWPTSEAEVFVEQIDLVRSVVGDINGVIAGHSGIPFKKKVAGISWINPGVIGMPAHNGDQNTHFGVLSETGYELRKLFYANEQAQQSMQRLGLDHGYDAALCTGYWPSIDVFPPEMTDYLSLDIG